MFLSSLLEMKWLTLNRYAQKNNKQCTVILNMNNKGLKLANEEKNIFEENAWVFASEQDIKFYHLSCLYKFVKWLNE